jgi:hypothetical protein
MVAWRYDARGYHIESRTRAEEELETRLWCYASGLDPERWRGLVRLRLRGIARGGAVLFVVTIQDKMLYGEPDIALAIVDALDEEAALRVARPTIEQLAERGRGRCVPHARLLEVGKFYRLGAVIRVPRDPNAESGA